MKELLEDIVRAIVDDVEAVKVNILDTESTTIYELHVAKEDVGKVIGKKAQVDIPINSIIKLDDLM